MNAYTNIHLLNHLDEMKKMIISHPDLIRLGRLGKKLIDDKQIVAAGTMVFDDRDADGINRPYTYFTERYPPGHPNYFLALIYAVETMACKLLIGNDKDLNRSVLKHHGYTVSPYRERDAGWLTAFVSCEDFDIEFG